MAYSSFVIELEVNLVETDIHKQCLWLYIWCLEVNLHSNIAKFFFKTLNLQKLVLEKWFVEAAENACTLIVETMNDAANKFLFVCVLYFKSNLPDTKSFLKVCLEERLGIFRCN